jgi:phenylalanine-4-hydroxylase
MLRRSFLRTCAAAAKSAFEQQYASTGSGIKGGSGRVKTSIQCSVDRNRPGSLLSVLQPFMDHGVSVHHVSNRPVAYESPSPYLTMFLDVDAHVDDERMQAILPELRKRCPVLTIVGSWKIPWYPTEIQHLDLLDQSTLAAGAELEDDPENPHPGFHDQEYRARRKVITEAAKSYRHGDKLPTVQYTEKEKDTWTVVWDKLTALYPTHACKQYNYVFPLLVENAGFRRHEIPQLQQVSDYLEATTGFTIRPVTGLLSSRDFLNALAFRVFFSTQYLRHHSQPLYTPEPDLVHELMGHVPLFADPDFALFSQTLGLASLGASDKAIEELARCYWYTVEFGLTRQPGGVRAFGAGLLSSFGELEYCLSGKSEYLPWDPLVASQKPFPITQYQPTYFVADGFKDAQVKLARWVESLERPFDIVFNNVSRKVLTYPKTAASLLHDAKI